MKIGVHFNFQNYTDWDRFEAKSGSPQSISDSQLYEEELHLAGLIEPLGFDSYWAIDHHFSPYVMTGGAIQHLTYMAGQTSRIDFGTMVIVLPWYDPIVIAEQVAVLDNMLQGRKLTIGLGRGAGQREFDAYRIPMGESRGRFMESLEIFRKALSQEWFSHEGDFYTIPETTIRPRPRNAQELVDSLIIAWVSPDTLPIAANAGLGMLLTNQKSWDEYQQDVRDFNAVRAGNGWEPKQPTVAVNVACASTESEAWDSILRHTIEAQISVDRHYHFSDAAHFKQADGYKFYEAFAKTLGDKTPEELGEFNAKPQAFGTPDQVLEKIKAIQVKTGAEEIICNFRMGGMPAADAEASMRLFASDVLPALHEVEAKLPVEMAGMA
jgi:alkanesulfonate monooxygenase SsuD/methylene tetrahydromethanopterin reductase-like flavin-dependent oxidoreductase (luciferase family)